MAPKLSAKAPHKKAGSLSVYSKKIDGNGPYTVVMPVLLMFVCLVEASLMNTPNPNPNPNLNPNPDPDPTVYVWGRPCDEPKPIHSRLRIESTPGSRCY